MDGANKIPNKDRKPLVLVEEPVLDGPVKKLYNSFQSDTVSIISLIDAKVTVTGTVTGKSYVFARAGTVVAVDNKDANEILNKKRGRACCGGQSGTSLFELA